MNPSFNLYSVLMIIGLVQGLFLGTILLLQKRKNKTPNVILAFLTYSIAFSCLGVTFLVTNYFEPGYYLYPFFAVTPATVGTLLYLYVKSLIIPNYGIKKLEWFHLLGIAVNLLILFTFYSYSVEEKHDLILSILLGKPLTLERVSVAFRLSIRITYTLLAIRLLYLHRQKIKHFYSNLKLKNLKWLNNLLIMCFVIIPVLVLLRILGYNLEVVVFGAIYMGSVNYAIGYFFLKQPEIYSDLDEKDIVSGQYEKSALKEEQVPALKTDTIRLMENQKLYLDPGLSIKSVATKLKVSTHVLSELLNKYFNQNFHDFVNEYRIEEAKTRLKDYKYQNYTVLAIGLDVGFNSKSTFNSVFKKHTGITPSEYRSVHLQPVTAGITS